MHLISQIGLVVSVVYLAVSTAAAYRHRGIIRYLSGAAAGLFALASVLYLVDASVGIAVTLAALVTLLVPAILVRPARLIEPDRVR